jgi:hypothetical protein
MIISATIEIKRFGIVAFIKITMQAHAAPITADISNRGFEDFVFVKIAEKCTATMSITKFIRK